MRFKFYLNLFVLVSLLILCIFTLKAFSDSSYYKAEVKRKNEIIQKMKTVDRLRIDKISDVVINIAKTYPAVGQSLNELIVDLKENRTIGIDQKIADLPKEMQEAVIAQNVNSWGVWRVKMFNEDYDFPVNVEFAYIPSKWGEFGWRPKVFDEETYQYVFYESLKNGKWTLHPAWDFVNYKHPEVLASNYGEVIEIGESPMGGKFIIVEHRIEGEPLRRTGYYHLSEIKVEKGEMVTKKQIIGYIGNSGCSTSPHLHFELKEYDKKLKLWVNKNPVIGTVHNRKWMAGYYWVKIKSHHEDEETGVVMDVWKWKLKVL